MLKVIASSTCDVCFVEYSDDNPPHCIPCGHVSCKSCLESMIATTHTSGGAAGSARCAFCRTLFEQAGVRRLHVDLGAVPSEAATSDDGSETVNGDDDENRVLARDAERLAVGVANAIFAKDEAKITRTATESQRWIATQRRTKPTAGFPVLTALTQLAVGNMENYHACQTLEQKLLDSRAKEARLAEKVRSFEDMGLREQQNFEKIRTLEQELDNLKQSLASSERSLRSTTSSLADATASLAEADTALAAAKAELSLREEIRAERDALKAELEAAQAAKEESRVALSKAKKELSGTKHELKQLRADMNSANGPPPAPAPTPGPSAHVGDETAVDSAAEAPIKAKLTRRRSRKMSHSAPKAATAEEASGSGAVAPGKKEGARVKKSRKVADGEKTEDEGDLGKTEEHGKSGEHSRKHRERTKERGREKKRDKEKDLEKDKDHEDHPAPEPELTTEPPSRPHTAQPDTPDSKGEKHHKSGKSRKKHSATHEREMSPERSATAPPGTEAETQAALKILTDSLFPSNPGSVNGKSSDPMSPPVMSASTSKGATSPPATTPRRGLMQTATEALSKPPLSREGAAMRVLRKAIGRKTTTSPNASYDLGSASTVVNMKPAPEVSTPTAGSSSSSAPAAQSPPTPISESPVIVPSMSVPSSDSLPLPQTATYSPYPVPSLENIAGFGVPTLPHGQTALPHGQPTTPHGQTYGSYPVPHVDSARRFPETTARGRGQSSTPEADSRPPNPLPRPPRASEDDPESGYERDLPWTYDSIWDQNRSVRGKGRDRDDRRDDRKRSGRDARHLPNEWQSRPSEKLRGEGVTPVLRRYVAAEDVPGLSASSRHGFDGPMYGESPPAYPMYEHGMFESGIPRKSSFGNIRSMK